MAASTPMFTPGRLVPYKLKASQAKESPTGKLKVSSPRVAKSPKSVYVCTVSSYEDENGTEVPMFMAMADLCITPTGFPNLKLKDELCRKVGLMCGEVSQSFTSKTTHILAGHAKTSKVEIGRLRNVPIVTVEWVEHLWEACNRGNNPYIHASLPKYRDFECPLFYNIRFYFSKHFDPDMKGLYEKIVKEHGGRLVTNLKHIHNSYYICQKHENEGIYRYALGKGVPCVNAAWISESIRLKTLVDTEEYEVRLRPSHPLGETFDMKEEYDEVFPTVSAEPERYQGGYESLVGNRKRSRLSTWEGDRTSALSPLYGSNSHSSRSALNTTSINLEDSVSDPVSAPNSIVDQASALSPRCGGDDSGSDSDSSTSTLDATCIEVEEEDLISFSDADPDSTLTSVAG